MTNDYSRLVGKRLALLRDKSGYSQVELAKRLNVSPSTIAMWELGEREIKVSTLIRLADFFNVTTEYLTGRSDNPSPEHENIFFYEWDKLSEEDKEKALAHIKFLQHMAEQENKKK